MLGYTRRLKALHEQEHPKSKGGRPSRTVPKAGKVSKPERFTKAHAKRTGRSEAAVQQDVVEATALGDDVMKKIVGTSLDKPSEITALISATGRRRFGPEGAIRACRGRLRLGLGRSTGLVASVLSVDSATVSSGLCTRTLLLNCAEQDCAVGLAGGHRPNYARYWRQ
jgi:hypothetical protein